VFVVAPSTSLSPAERSLRARLAAHEKWARTSNTTAATAPARQAFLDSFERQVDPDGTLTPAERARRAESARKAYYLRLALKSAQARRARARAAQLDAEVEAALGGDVASSLDGDDQAVA
jgi:hypothetical protein